MFDALQIGISWSDFWRMSARAVYHMESEWIRRHEGQATGGKGKKTEKKGRRRLASIPRP